MKIRGQLITALLLLVFASCHTKSNNTTSGSNTDTTLTGNKPAVTPAPDSTANLNDLDALDLSKIDTTLTATVVTDTGNAIIVSGPKAFILTPDNQSLEKEKQEDSDGFYSMTDDYSYYTSIAVDSMHTKNITSEFYQHEKRYLVFKNKAHTICTFDGNKMPYSWGILFFNGIDTPLLWNGTTPGPAITKIYGK